MHFREVPLIQHEIQFKTWSASHSSAFDSVPDISSSEEAERELMRRRMLAHGDFK